MAAYCLDAKGISSLYQLFSDLPEDLQPFDLFTCCIPFVIPLTKYTVAKLGSS